MQGSLMSAFDEAFVRQILKMILDGAPENLTRLLDTQLRSGLIPDWYRDDILSHIYSRLKEEQKRARTRADREKLLSAVELMNDRYGASLSVK